jgi:hypothetical protein
VVKTGLVAPFEGDRIVRRLYAARLAVEAMPPAASASKLALVALDDRGDADLATQTAAALVVDIDVVAVVGHICGNDRRGAEVYANGSYPSCPPPRPPSAAADPTALPPPSSPPTRASPPSTDARPLRRANLMPSRSSGPP